MYPSLHFHYTYSCIFLVPIFFLFDGSLSVLIEIFFKSKTGLGRRKFLPKPLPQEINMLLSECDINRYSDSTEKSITTQTPPTTTVTSSTDTRTSITSEQSPFKNQLQSTNVNSCNEYYNGHHNMDTFDDDDDDDGNRIGYVSSSLSLFLYFRFSTHHTNNRIYFSII